MGGTIRFGQVELTPEGIASYATTHRSQSLAAVGLACAVLALVTPWYGIDLVMDGTHEGSLDFSLTAVSLYSPPDGYWVVMPYDARACSCASVGAAFQNAMFLASAGILLLAVASAARMRGMKIGDEPMKALVAISGLLIILAPLYLAFGLPGAFTADGQAGGGGGSYDSDAGFGKSFVGTNSTTAFGNTISWSWSPTWGWLFALVGGLLILLGAALAGAPPRPAAADAPQSGWTAASPQQSWTPGQAQPVPTPPARPAPLDERYATRSFP